MHTYTILLSIHTKNEIQYIHIMEQLALPSEEGPFRTGHEFPPKSSEKMIGPIEFKTHL